MTLSGWVRRALVGEAGDGVDVGAEGAGQDCGAGITEA